MIFAQVPSGTTIYLCHDHKCHHCHAQRHKLHMVYVTTEMSRYLTWFCRQCLMVTHTGFSIIRVMEERKKVHA